MWDPYKVAEIVAIYLLAMLGFLVVTCIVFTMIIATIYIVLERWRIKEEKKAMGIIRD
jgi:isoprenylcysteine carboxyl methyltransferase (ICMT) family protein YpbQ